MAFINYPASNFRFGKKSVTFYVNGNSQFKAKLTLVGIPKAVQPKIKVEVKNKSIYTVITANPSSHFEFPADTKVRLTWSTL